MKASVADVVTVLAIAGLAALGGALAVYAEYDDSPGGVLIGFLLIVGAVTFGVRSALRRSQHSQSGRVDSTMPR